MENPTSIIFLSLIIAFNLLISSVPAKGGVNSLITRHDDAPSVCRGPPRSYKIEFYVQDLLTGPNQSVYEVARASITPSSPSLFGIIRVSDSKLTSTPDYNSQELGRAQGFVVNADLKVLAIDLNMNFVFTSGKYNGSTVSVLGRNAVFSEQNRESAVIGGTGMFRCARGYAIGSTYTTNITTSNSVMFYTIYVTSHR